jgi:hypothetical protein
MALLRTSTRIQNRLLYTLSHYSRNPDRTLEAPELPLRRLPLRRPPLRRSRGARARRRPEAVAEPGRGAHRAQARLGERGRHNLADQKGEDCCLFLAKSHKCSDVSAHHGFQVSGSESVARNDLAERLPRRAAPGGRLPLVRWRDLPNATCLMQNG